MSGNHHGDTILRRLAALPEGTWRACAKCSAVQHVERLLRNRSVCPECNHHDRLPAQDRISQLLDAGTFEEIDEELVAGDPLEFTDRIPYPRRLAQARERTGLSDAVVSGTGRIDGRPVVLAVQDFGFLGGSMGAVVGEKLARAAELALARRVPLVTVASSGGARMQEGIHSLLQMAKTAAAVQRLREGGVPFVSVLADPVYGGVAASFAALGDVIVAESGTRAGFAGPQVIEQTIRQKLPKGFQTAEFLQEQGHIDLVVSRAELPAVVSRIVAFCAGAGRAPDGPVDEPPPAGAVVREPWDAVRVARDLNRPNTLGYLDRMFTGFLPLHGDRWAGDDAAVVGGLAWLAGAPVVVVGHCKGRDTADNVKRNFGMPQPAGYRKAMRLFRLAERWGAPVVTLVDTPGAYPGIDAERANQSGAIAETLALCTGLRVPLVSVVIGEGGSGGALALAVGDRLLMQENTVYSVISPEGCATILFGDAGRAPAAAKALRLRACDLAAMGIADELVPEPDGGSGADPHAAAAALAEALRRHLAELVDADRTELLAARLRRLRGYGRLVAEPAQPGWLELDRQAVAGTSHMEMEHVNA